MIRASPLGNRPRWQRGFKPQRPAASPFCSVWITKLDMAMGSTKTQIEEELADEWSFLFWQFDLPNFQMARSVGDCQVLGYAVFAFTRIRFAAVVPKAMGGCPLTSICIA